MFEYKVDDITVYCASAFDTKSEFNGRIERKIAEWIVDCLEKDIVQDILEKNYEGFSKFDKIYLVEKVVFALDSFKEVRKKHIEKRICDYLSNEKLINISGFIRFRLKDYKREIEKIVDEIVEKYICEKEYYEFLQIIREYIRFQEPVFSLLHIVTEGDKVRYFDKNWTELTKMLEKEYSFETDLSNDDKLLTILVLSAPEKIVWHNSEKVKNKELKTTISEIFQDALVLCENCENCVPNVKNVLTISKN